MKEILIYLTISIVFVSSEKVGFENYSLFKISPKNEQHITLLKDLHKRELNFDFWNDPISNAEFVNIMASPEDKGGLQNWLNTYGMEYEITISNIQELINKQSVSTYTRNSRNMRWDMYYTLADIEAWMSDLARAYPDILTEVVGGSTFEGREIRGIKLSHGTGRRVIFIEAGIHAREWITPTAACYLLNELLTSEDEETMAAARDFDWYIIPVTNPDGYHWTHLNTTNRMWRKNRRPIAGTNNFGIDLNRNWNSNWLGEGVSVNPAAETYPGLGPFSEPETRTLSEYIRSVADDIDLYLSFHSFSQLLLLPYGNTTDPLDNYYDAMKIGRRAMGALSVRYGTQYVTGNIAEAIYLATGTSIDWVKEHLRVPLVYCYEFRDRGTFGFLLPAEQILPNNQEMMDSVLEMILQAKRFGYMNSGVGIRASIAMIILVFLKVLL